MNTKRWIVLLGVLSLGGCATAQQGELSLSSVDHAVESLAADEPRVVLQREPHRGKGGAVRAGMLASDASLRFLCDAVGVGF